MKHRRRQGWQILAFFSLFIGFGKIIKWNEGAKCFLMILILQKEPPKSLTANQLFAKFCLVVAQGQKYGIPSENQTINLAC